MRIYKRKQPVAGEKYGNLVLTGNFKIGRLRETHAEAICECGKLFYARWNNFRIGKTKSCGCKSTELKIKAMTTHGLSPRSGQHPIYYTWYGIKQRCYNPKSIYYKNYGGRGIAMCDEWLNDFLAFYNWAITNGWRKGLTIDRERVNEDYIPYNCRWITNLEQQKNKTVSVFFEIFGERKIQADWGRDPRCNVSIRTFSERVKNGWRLEDALTIVLRA